MNVQKKKHKILAVVVIAVIVVCGYLYWQNTSISISESEYCNAKIPETFEGFTIAQVSDLHNKMFGKNQKYLLAKLKSSEPDIIVVTGDIIDRRKYHLDNAISFVKGAVKIAPVYYVSGNHEAWLADFESAKDQLIDAGLIFMDDTSVTLKNGDTSIGLLGVSDPDFLTKDYAEGNDVTKMIRQLAKWSADDRFKILLTHRPELFDLYAENKMDLVFAGHAHGGQIRIPFLGALVAPDQGWFPQYTNGCYVEGDTTMFVSRGLGNSLFPLRINNRPEIVVVKLKN